MVIALICAGCSDRSKPVVGVAMGRDTGMATLLLQGRQQRLNDSLGGRNAVELRIGVDSGPNPSSLTWANTLVQTPGLVGVVGDESSRSALQTAPLYREREVVQIVPTGTSSKLALVSPWTFPLVASDASQGAMLAHHIAGTGRKHVTLFVQDDEYGRGIVKSIKNGLGSTDVLIVDNVMHTLLSDLPLLVRSTLTRQPKPDVMVLIAQGGVAVSVARLAWTRDSSILILGSDAAISGATELRALAPAPDKLALATYWLPDSTNQVTQTFLRDYKASKLGGEPQWNHAALYDAVGLLNAAALEVGSNPSAVRDWLLSLGRNRPVYKGVLGDIDFTGKHAIAARLIRPSATGWELVK